MIKRRDLRDLLVEWDKELLPDSLYSTFQEVVSKWPDSLFAAPDGRGYYIAQFGNSFDLRVEAFDGDFLTEKQQAWLKARPGGGVVVDSEENMPMVFDDADTLCARWRELKETFGLSFTDAENDLFDIENDPEDEED